MKLYQRPGFPNPARIHIVLAEKRLARDVAYVDVDLIGAEHKAGPFLAKNPLGVLPVLELDDGTLLSECTAITEYLDNLDGNPVLTGRTPREKGLIHMMQRRAESEVLDPVGHYFHHATPGLGNALQAFKSQDWAGRAEWGEREGRRAAEGLRYFNDVLRAAPWVAGERFSMADITLLAGIWFAGAAGIAVPPELDALHEWLGRVSDLPSVKGRGGQQMLPEDLRRLGF
ncbi:glutathione S-transferase [Massilia dura]|uniref:Glutathione S-transferase n=1 Tax=Pseudoduganella dura TaxID=321982 RepID=A0A6I3X6E3_9BURK|nr:glutathione S-transferase [Pseudoduganella dura]MUI12314.1 glutathione S-transferase [Pseudoduganella dura]GGY07067.1 glutathione S-transferase [Pseudoduganella dura]